jgi:hypothetical protein
MKKAVSAVMLAGALSLMLGCQTEPVQRVNVPGSMAEGPAPAPKPLPPDGYMPGQPLPPAGQAAPQGPTVEEAFLQAYTNKRSPRIMVMVNQTIHGDPLPTDQFNDLARNSAAPPEYDSIGASPADYEMIEASIVKYFDESGKVRVTDADAARAKLQRAQLLRVENGDPAAARLLAAELKADILIRVTATPTRHSSYGNAVRIIAKAVGTSDARNLGTAFGDMPLPMTKPTINVATHYVTQELMGEMAQKWLAPPEYDPVEIRIYKTASVDDALRLKKWLQATKGVQNVTTNAATGGANTSYASFSVSYAGAPEDLYSDLKDAIGASQGLKAVDVQSRTIDLEVTGQLNLVTTTRKSDTITTTTTTTTEDKKVEPINPAPPQ